MAKSPNPRLIKLHRSYSVEEAAKRCGLHKNTVRTWIKNGLPSIAGRGPTLILGSELRCFLEERRRQAKRPCPPGHLYCLKCREPRPAAGGMIEFVPLTATSGNLRALCPECTSLMNRRITEAAATKFQSRTGHSLAEAASRLSERPSPSLTSDSSKAA